MSFETKNRNFKDFKVQIRIAMMCGTVHVAGSGKLEKRRYDINLDPEIQTKIEQGTKKAVEPI